MTVNYTDKNGKEVILIQDPETRDITVMSRAVKDIDAPFFKPVKKGEMTNEFQVAGKKKDKLLTEEELVEWYENEYLPFRRNLDDKLEKIFCDDEGDTCF